MRFVVPAVLLGLASSLGATTLVAVWTPKRLDIAADSLMVTDTVSVPACKISHEGETYFALSGLVEDRTVGYSLAPLAREAMKQPGTLNEKLAAFIQRVRAPLATAVQALRAQSPDDYGYLTSGHPVIQAIFGQVQSGSPLLAVASFQLDPAGGLREYASVLADANDNRGPRVIYAGQQQKIREYLHAHPDWYSGDPAELARSLVQLEIDAGGRVGGPVDMVSLGPNGANWLQKKNECGD